MRPEGRGTARELERLRYTYRRRLAGLSDDELEEEARRIEERIARLKRRLHEVDTAMAALDDATRDDANAASDGDSRAANEERRHELHAERQRLYLDLTTDLFRKQAALSAEEVRRWGGE